MVPDKVNETLKAFFFFIIIFIVFVLFEFYFMFFGYMRFSDILTNLINFVCFLFNTKKKKFLEYPPSIPIRDLKVKENNSDLIILLILVKKRENAN